MNADKNTIELMKKSINSLKMGTLRFWGEWFGRPMDNCHKITEVQFNQQEDILILIFNEGETLTICNPANIEFNSKEFYIRNASRIRWEWYSYGNHKIAQNRYFQDFIKQDGIILKLEGKTESLYINKKNINYTNQLAIEIC